MTPIARSSSPAWIESEPPTHSPFSRSTPERGKSWLAPGLVPATRPASQAADAALRFRGKTTVNVEPTPGAERTESEPSICSTIFREM
jgi:hypothetical protein